MTFPEEKKKTNKINRGSTVFSQQKNVNKKLCVCV